MSFYRGAFRIGIWLALLLPGYGMTSGCVHPNDAKNGLRTYETNSASAKNTETAPELLREIFHLDGTQAHLSRVQLVDAIISNALIKISAGLDPEAKPSDEHRRALQARLSEKIRKAYSKRALSEEMVESWARSADLTALAEIRTHLRSKIYQRYLARLTEVKSATGQRKLGVFLARTAKHGLKQERVNLARRWLRATQEKEVLYLLSYDMSQEIFAAAKPLLKDWAGESYQSFQNDMDARGDAFRTRIEKSLFYETLFAFDRFSLSEQEELVTFWESRKGFSYVQKKMSTLRDVLDRAHDRFRSEVAIKSNP